MISEIEKMELRKELEEFRKGIKNHVYAIQEYINIWAKGGESDQLSKIHLQLSEQIERLIIDSVYMAKANTVQDDKRDAHNPFFNAIIKRLYKKITK